MNEIPAIPWGRVISHLVWILGAAIILAALGYQEFLAHLEKELRGKKESEKGEKKSQTGPIKHHGLRSKGFKKALFFGLTLVFAGASAAISRALPSVILGVSAYFTGIKYLKILLKE